MLASFRVIPTGEGDHFKNTVAEVLRIVQKCGLDYRLGAMQTTVEGDAERVVATIMECHNEVMKHHSRCFTSIDIDDHKGATNRLEGKVRDVEEALGEETSHE